MIDLAAKIELRRSSRELAHPHLTSSLYPKIKKYIWENKFAHLKNFLNLVLGKVRTIHILRTIFYIFLYPHHLAYINENLYEKLKVTFLNHFSNADVVKYCIT